MTSLTFFPGGCNAAMGLKERVFPPLPREISLEDLVPKDNFYRRLEGTLDLSFVRDLVAPLYARGGRPKVAALRPPAATRLDSLRQSIRKLAGILPEARHVEFDGLNHVGSWNASLGGRPGVVAAALREFFA